jgi:glutamate/tyrosine decarboxylase-like PLP-dependent enzyme
MHTDSTLPDLHDPTPADLLDPTRSDLHHSLARVSELALAFAKLDETAPVRTPVNPAVAAADLELALPDNGRPIDAVLDHVSRVLAATPATAGPRFFNQLFGGRDAAATATDMLASLANNSMYTYKVAGPMVLIENLLIEKMGALAGFDSPEGIITPGGSLSNLAALICARDAAVPGSREAGIDGRRMRIYSSAEAHYSIRKSVGMLGMGRQNLVKVACDSEGRMRPDALDAAITADLAAGLRPTMISATSGTTVRAAFDPIDALADVAEKHGVWLHVDGAFGASVLLSEAHRSLMAGIERADSLTWDAHKMMGVPLTCSLFVARERGRVTASLNETAEYLYQGDSEALNPGTRSLQCGRRNDVLKLWAGWQYHGLSGYSARIERLFTLAQALTARVVAAPDMTLVGETASVNVCFVLDGHDADAICAELAARGQMLVGHANVLGRTVFRVPFVHPNFEESDLDVLLDAIREVGAALKMAEA